MTATASAPASAACAANAAVSAVVWAPACTATCKRPSAAATKSSATRRRSSIVSRMPSPVVPSGRIPSTPPAARKSTYGATASSSSARPSSQRGVTAAAMAPRSMPSTLSSAAMSALRIEREGPILRVTLARPERRNAFDASLIAELTDTFSDVGDARAVVLSSEGQSFCAGADVDWQRSAIDLSFDDNVEDALRLYRMCETIDRCPAPVIARVQGYALGGGSGLVACADIAIAAPDAVFGFSEVKLGIVPAVISPFVLPKIGAHARRYFLTGERFDARAALRIGLIHEVADDVDGAVEGVVGELLSSGPEAVRAAKALIRDRPGGDEAARIAARLRAGPEGQDGLRAFLERRPARWL